jgi:beta-glucosidase
MLAAALSAPLTAKEVTNPDWQAEQLLSQMTLDEKVGQMTQVDMLALTDKHDIQKYFLGSVLSGGSSDPADNSAASWLKAVEEFKSLALKTRLKIPLLYGIDAVNTNPLFPRGFGLTYK